MKRGIHYVPCQWCTDRRLLQEVMAYCLNFLVLQLTMTQKSAVCTTCHFNRVIRSYKSVGQFVIYVDRKSTRLNSSHVAISYAVFCLKKQKKTIILHPNCISM